MGAKARLPQPQMCIRDRGYTMVYGIAKMLNFAHGDIIMIGAYTGIITVAQMGLPPLFAVLFSILLCAQMCIRDSG